MIGCWRSASDAAGASFGRGWVRDSMRPSPASPARLPPAAEKVACQIRSRRCRRSRIENVSAAERLACERAAHNRGVALENRRPVGAVQPESGEGGRRAAGAQSKLEAAVRNEVEHRRVLGHADRLFQRQGHDARAETNSRRARRDMGEKHKRRGKTAFVSVEVMLGDPGRVEAMTLRLNDLLRREPVALCRCRPIQKPGEETKPYGFSPRHACRARSGVVERAKGRGVSPRAWTEELILRPRQSKILSQRPALVFAPEQASTLQLGNHPVDEIVEAFGHVGEHDIEPVATLLRTAIAPSHRRWSPACRRRRDRRSFRRSGQARAR